MSTVVDTFPRSPAHRYHDYPQLAMALPAEILPLIAEGHPVAASMLKHSHQGITELLPKMSRRIVLCHAALEGLTDVVEFLLNGKSRLMIDGHSDEFAAAMNQPKHYHPLDYVVVRMDLEVVADWHSRGWLSNFAISLAAETGRLDIVSFLLKDPKQVSSDAMCVGLRDLNVELLRLIQRVMKYKFSLLRTLDTLDDEFYLSGHVINALQLNNVPFIYWVSEVGVKLAKDHAIIALGSGIEMLSAVRRNNPEIFERTWYSAVLRRENAIEILECAQSSGWLNIAMVRDCGAYLSGSPSANIIEWIDNLD